MSDTILHDAAGPDDGRNAGRLSRYWCLGRVILKGLWTQKGQQAITLISMICGSMAFSMVFFIGDGALKGVWADVQQLMGNWVMVTPMNDANNVLGSRRKEIFFTRQEFNCVRRHMESARYVVPFHSTRRLVQHGVKGVTMSVDGIVQAMESEKMYTVLEGERFSDQARQAMVKECLVTESAARQLDLGSIRGMKLLIGKHTFNVVGLIPDPPTNDRAFQARIAVPLAIAQMLWEKPGFFQLLIVAWESPDTMQETVGQLETALNQCRQPGSFMLSSSIFKVAKARTIISKFMLYGTAQALFIILVAAVGILNVMLADVTRRTREFAIRLAFGASHRDIFIIVLSQSCLVGLIGASGGVLLSVFLSRPVAQLVAAQIPQAAQAQPSITLVGVLLPLGVCTACAFLAGLLPALKVRRLDVLASLRQEK